MPIANRVVTHRVTCLALAALLAAAAPARGESPAVPPGLVAAPGGRPAPRSHLQPVGEVVATAPAVDAGLKLTRAPQVLRDQLALERGSGLVVETVQPSSAAARAGFHVNDVLVRIDDQLMLLPEQFAAFLEATPRGVPLACHVLRAGKPVLIDLDARDGAVPSNAASAAPRDALRPAASTLAKLPRLGSPSETRTAPPPPTLALPGNGSGASAPPAPPVAQTLVRKDPDYQIRLTAGDDTRLVVTDRAGRLVFDDCIDTPEARSRLPRAVRERVERMEQHLEVRVPAGDRPAAEIGRLDVAPITVR